MKGKPDANDFSAASDYNDWIDEQYTGENGELTILGFKPRPSDVLHQLSYDTYEAGFADFKAERDDAIRETVKNDFPILIAHPFYRFLAGAEHEVQRLQFLRDTWEALITFVHAMVVSEARAMGMVLADPVKCGNLFSDSQAARLKNVQDILALAQANGVVLECAQYVDLSTITTIEELNRARNAFSHSGAVSEEQAKTYISDCIEDVLDVLEAFDALKAVRLLRYDRLDGGNLRHERFDGHSKTKRFDTIPPNGIALPLQTKDETLVCMNGKIFSVRPFICFAPQPGGHVTNVCFFKKTKGDPPDRKLLFEIVGESQEVEKDRSLFQTAINEIRGLFGLAPE